MTAKTVAVVELSPCGECGLVHGLRGSKTIPACKGHKKRNRGGGPCGAPRMTGQEICYMHGGANPGAIAAAEKRMAERDIILSAEAFGLGLDLPPVDAHEALLSELQRTHASVAWLGAVVADLEQGEIMWGMARTKSDGVDRGTTYEAGLNMWVKMWQQERDRLVAVAAACARAGIDERRTLIVESQARALAGVVQRILNAMYESLVGLLGEQDAARVVLESAWPDLVSTIVPGELRAVATSGGGE